MKKSNLSPVEQSVLNVVKKQHLPTHEILNKLDDVPMMFSLYSTIDNLRRKGKIKRYKKDNVMYHFATN